MNILGIETSTAVCGVAVLNNNGPAVERSVVQAHIHSEKLLTLVKEALDEAALAMGEIDGVAVSIGPGSFTGLRIGLSSAKGFCFALGKPLVAVPTFDAVAASASRLHPNEPRIAIALDAKQGDYYYASYSNSSSSLHCEEAVEVLSAERLSSAMQRSGSAMLVTDRADFLARLAHADVRIVSMTDYCHATTVATLGMKKIIAREFADIASIEPMYLKDFVVRTAVQQ